MFSPALMPDRLPSKVARFGPDIVHLHWVVNGFMRVETAKRFNRPLIWSLHDSWAFTGGCHVPGDCERYLQCCGKCPVLASSRENDMSRWVWKRKRRHWDTLNLTVVAPSRWLGKCASASSLLQGRRVEVIPNGIDTERFRPAEKRVARQTLSLPLDKKLILFGGANVVTDPNKGFHLLEEALRRLAGRGQHKNAELVVFGASEPANHAGFGMSVRYFGWLSDEMTIALLNAAADVAVVPSIQEALSYAAMEALACGTPCVAFNQGGVSDVVEHGLNGYLARPYEPDDLAEGIAWVLENEERRKMLSLHARQKVEQEFALEKIAGRYMELYRGISCIVG